MPSWVMSWIPPLSVVLVVVALVAAARWVFERRSAGAASRAVHRQGLIALLLFAGVLSLIISLPLEDSTQAQLLSLIGLLVSAAIALSSTTFIGNMMAGVLLRVLRNFRPGDFIIVEGNFGRVSGQGLLHTEIQTEDRDLVTLPNLFLVTHPLRVIRSSGTVVSADVSLGYDVAHQRIEGALAEAAESAGLSEPFVRIIELGDFSVSYRVAGILIETKQLLTARSRLRAAVLDGLHGAGIEIVSPNFMNQRIVSEPRPVIPPPEPVAAGASSSEEIFPEELVFDKAEHAESMEKLRSAFDSLQAKVSELEEELRKAEEGSGREALERRVKRAHVLRERLQRRINESESGDK